MVIDHIAPIVYGNVAPPIIILTGPLHDYSVEQYDGGRVAVPLVYDAAGSAPHFASLCVRYIDML